MAALIEKSDVIDGASINTNSDTITIKRKFIVKEVTGPAVGKLINADQAPGIPQIGDPYPVFTLPRVFCSSKSTKPLPGQSEQFEIICVYQPQTSESQTPDDNGQATQMIGGSVVAAETTNKVDRQGNVSLIVLERKNQADEKDNLPPQTGVISKQIPIFSIIFTRHEASNPIDRARQFVGKINSPDWGLFGEATALCTRIEGATDNGGESYQVTYEFQIKESENGWIAEVVYIDQDTDKPLVDAAFNPPDDNTLTTANIYELADFNALSLF